MIGLPISAPYAIRLLVDYQMPAGITQLTGVGSAQSSGIQSQRT